MTEVTRKTLLALVEFYDTMKKLESIESYQEREGKKATKLIMTCNDIEAIFEKYIK